jgi:hypothetical protein
MNAYFHIFVLLILITYNSYSCVQTRILTEFLFACFVSYNSYLKVCNQKATSPLNQGQK